jgi:hypothetical protein
VAQLGESTGGYELRGDTWSDAAAEASHGKPAPKTWRSFPTQNV